MDLSSQVYQSSTQIVIHPSAYYVGIFSKNQIDPEDQTEAQIVVADKDGKLIENVDVELTIRTSFFDQRISFANSVKTPTHIDLLSFKSEKHPYVLSLNPKTKLPEKDNSSAAPSYTPDLKAVTIQARVTDTNGYSFITFQKIRISRPADSQFLPMSKPLGSSVKAELLETVNEKSLEIRSVSRRDDAWKINETAEIEFESPHFPCEGVLFILCNGIVKSKSFRMKSSKKVLKIPILEEYAPKVGIVINLVGG